MGESKKAGDLIEKLREAGQSSYVPAESLMIAWAGQSDPDSVLTCAERSLGDRDPMTIMCLLQEPILDFVRANPRFKALLSKINLP